MSRPSRAALPVTIERREKTPLAPVNDEEALVPSRNLRITRSDSIDSPNPGAYAVATDQRSLEAEAEALGSSTRSWDPTDVHVNEMVPDSDPPLEEQTFDTSPQPLSPQALPRPPPMEATVAFLTGIVQKRGLNSWRCVVTTFCLFVAVGGTILTVLGLTGRASRPDAFSASQLVDECDFTSLADPSPILQCSCFSSISISSESTKVIYNDLKDSQILSEYDGPDKECQPENIALWWSAMDMIAPTSFDFSSYSTIQQRLGLALLYVSLEGWGTLTSLWLSKGSECEWQGIQCDSSLSVSVINLYKMGLIGELPSHSFRFFPALTQLTLLTNELHGQIPTEIWTLGKLQSLVLGYNQFEGTIPDNISNLSALTYLNFYSNFMMGSIPEGLYSLTLLKEMSLSSNTFTGTISDKILQLSHLEWANFEMNNFIGTLPTTLGSLSQLQKLSFSSNYFSGTLPTELALLSNHLAYFTAGSNELTGTLPIILGSLTKLTALDLNTNYLSGTIPTVFGMFTNLGILDLGFNRLSGSLPSLHVTTKLILSGNQFSGTVPDSYCSTERVSLPCAVVCECCHLFYNGEDCEAR